MAEADEARAGWNGGVFAACPGVMRTMEPMSTLAIKSVKDEVELLLGPVKDSEGMIGFVCSVRAISVPFPRTPDASLIASHRLHAEVGGRAVEQ